MTTNLIRIIYNRRDSRLISAFIVVNLGKKNIKMWRHAIVTVYGC